MQVEAKHRFLAAAVLYIVAAVLAVVCITQTSWFGIDAHDIEITDYELSGERVTDYTALPKFSMRYGLFKEHRAVYGGVTQFDFAYFEGAPTVNPDYFWPEEMERAYQKAALYGMATCVLLVFYLCILILYAALMGKNYARASKATPDAAANETRKASSKKRLLVAPAIALGVFTGCVLFMAFLRNTMRGALEAHVPGSFKTSNPNIYETYALEGTAGTSIVLLSVSVITVLAVPFLIFNAK